MNADAVLILGMHRSGTSCLTGSLEAAGLYLGEVFTANPHNRKGNRENARVMDLNTAVLRHSGGDWDTPPTSLSWTETHAQERNAIIETLRREQTSAWGFKDPRLTFTLPFWREAVAAPRLVASFRHPNAVAASLEVRNRFAREDSLQLWTRYNLELLRHLDASPFPVLCFDVTEEQYLTDLDRLCRALRLSPLGQRAPFFDTRLRRHRMNHDDRALPKQIAEIYARLLGFYRRQFDA